MDWQKYFLQGTEILFLGMGTYFDVKEREIPLELLMLFGILGSLYNVVWNYQSILNLLLGISIGGIFLVIGWITKEAIGYGDGFGLVVLGIYEGWKGMIPMVFLTLVFSGIYGVGRLIGFHASRNDTFPFYPFLFLSLLGVVLL